jgi:hypothetical protein
MKPLSKRRRKTLKYKEGGLLAKKGGEMWGDGGGWGGGVVNGISVW